MTTKTQQSIKDLEVLWARLEASAQAADPSGQSPRRVHILAESITIHNVIVAGELPPELSKALAARLSA